MKDINLAGQSAIRAELGKRARMYENHWDDVLDDELKKHFHEKTYPKVKPMLDTSLNMLRRIVREICTVYKEPAKRTLSGQSDDTAKKLEDLYKLMLVDQTMAVAHRYSKATTICGIHVLEVKDPDEFQAPLALRVLTPDQFYIETDPHDIRKITLYAYEAHIHDVKTDKDIIVWPTYTANEFWYCDNAGKALGYDPTGSDDYTGRNDLGLIPFVAFPCEFQVRGFYNPDWNRDAVQANIKIGISITDLNYLMKTASFKQIVISSDKELDEVVKGGILDPLYPLKLTGGATASTLDLNTQLESIDRVIRGKVMAIANNYGISNENFTLTTQAASGFSLKIANQSLQDIRMSDIPLCASVEAGLYRIIARMSEDLPEDAALQFNPGEVTWPDEWTTEEARWRFEYENGISSPVDYVIKQDPQLSREEAIARIQERQAEIKMLKPKTSAWQALLAGASPMAPGAKADESSPLAEVAKAGSVEKLPGKAEEPIEEPEA